MFLKMAFAMVFLTSVYCTPNANMTEESATEGYITRYNLWPKATVSVCFIKTTEATDTFRTLVQQTVVNGINNKTLFKFKGFGYCQNQKADVYIEVNELGRSSASIGQRNQTEFLGYKGRIRLFLEYLPGKKTPSFYMKNSILHEFGHVIGLHHEHLRDDSPSCEKVRKDNVTHEKVKDIFIKVGAYDQESIMNYCNPNYQKIELSLSNGDIRTINTAYGLPSTNVQTINIQPIVSVCPKTKPL
jgi:Astacin (Peptidase family M12A)